MALLTYVNYNHDYDVNQVRELLYCTSIIERALTKPDRTDPGSVSATMTFGLMDRYKCELQSTIVPADDGVWQSAVSTVPL